MEKASLPPMAPPQVGDGAGLPPQSPSIATWQNQHSPIRLHGLERFKNIHVLDRTKQKTPQYAEQESHTETEFEKTK